MSVPLREGKLEWYKPRQTSLETVVHTQQGQDFKLACIFGPDNTYDCTRTSNAMLGQ